MDLKKYGMFGILALIVAAIMLFAYNSVEKNNLDAMRIFGATQCVGEVKSALHASCYDQTAFKMIEGVQQWSSNCYNATDSFELDVQFHNDSKGCYFRLSIEPQWVLLKR